MFKKRRLWPKLAAATSNLGGLFFHMARRRELTSDAGTCNGKPAKPVGRHVRWERSEGGQAMRGPRVATIVRQAQEAAGLRAERGGMWRVREALDVRRREGAVAAWEVLVRWAGRHDDSWVARSALSRPVQREER